jgi:hypothetical protein
LGQALGQEQAAAQDLDVVPDQDVVLVLGLDLDLVADQGLRPDLNVGVDVGQEQDRQDSQRAGTGLDPGLDAGADRDQEAMDEVLGLDAEGMAAVVAVQVYSDVVHHSNNNDDDDDHNNNDDDCNNRNNSNTAQELEAEYTQIPLRNLPRRYWRLIKLQF